VLSTRSREIAEPAIDNDPAGEPDEPEPVEDDEE